MFKRFPSKRSGVALAVMAAAAGLSMPLMAQQDEVEEEDKGTEKRKEPPDRGSVFSLRPK